MVCYTSNTSYGCTRIYYNDTFYLRKEKDGEYKKNKINQFGDDRRSINCFINRL